MEATKTRKTFSEKEIRSRLKNGRLVTDADYRYKILCGVGLALAVIAYAMLYITRIYALSKGWAYTYYAMMQEGKIPYRDFYYYLPPGNLLMNWITYSIAGSTSVIAAYVRLVERVILCELLYFITAKRVQPLIAAVSVFGAMAIAMARTTELGGDYNQTLYVFLALLVIFFLKYTDNIEKPMRKKAGWLIGVGVCGGFLLSIKQTIVFTTFVMFFLLLTYLCLTGREKYYLTSCLFVLIGAVFVVAPFAVYLLANDAMEPFVQQVFLGASSKGDTKSLLGGNFIGFLVQNIERIVAVLALLLAYEVKKKRATSLKNTARKKVVYGVLLTVSVACFAHLMIAALWKGATVAVTSLVMIPLAALAAALLFLNERKRYYGLVVLGAMGLMMAALVWNVGDMTITFHKESGLFGYVNTLSSFGFFAVSLWLLYHIIVNLRQKKPALDKIVLSCAAIAAACATIMNNSGDTIGNAVALFLVPALCVIVFENLDMQSFRARVYTKALMVAVLCILCVSVAQRLVAPYSWWGYTSENYWAKTETSSLPELKGYKLSKSDIKLYDEVTKLIADNSDESSVIFGFPYVKCYNTLLGNFNTDTFVPVLFYDTCADKYAMDDAKTLEENEPDIVVWADIPNCMETHEEKFRGGNELGQREIQKWFGSVRKTDYTCIGQVQNVFVYKLTKDGQTVNRTYIENPSRSNKTAKYEAKLKLELTGKGTKAEPYLITSKADLENFRDVVNDGKIDLKDTYFRQTANIDLKDVKSWTPIGVYGEGNYFSGIYDGDGYEIRNLRIDEKEENVGLFGTLNGTVMNLNLVDCNLTGDCVGGITSHGKAKIYNCYVSGTLKAGRGGGVADNARADIVNCVTEVSLKGKGVMSGISGYYSNDIYHCFSTQGDDICVDDGQAIPENAAEVLNAYNPSDDNLKMDTTLLNQWVSGKDGLRVGHEKRNG